MRIFVQMIKCNHVNKPWKNFGHRLLITCWEKKKNRKNCIFFLLLRRRFLTCARLRVTYSIWSERKRHFEFRFQVLFFFSFSFDENSTEELLLLLKKHYVSFCIEMFSFVLSSLVYKMKIDLVMFRGSNWKIISRWTMYYEWVKEMNQKCLPRSIHREWQWSLYCSTWIDWISCVRKVNHWIVMNG